MSDRREWRCLGADGMDGISAMNLARDIVRLRELDRLRISDE